MAGLGDSVAAALGVRPAPIAGVTDDRREALRAKMREDAQIPGPELQSNERSPSGFSAAPVLAALGAKPAPGANATPAAPRERAFMGHDNAGPEALGGVLEGGAHMVTGIGKSIMGGWRGLAAIASGAGLEEAARQVESPELAGGTTAEAYTPAAGTPGAAVTGALDSPYNPMNWIGLAGDKAGEKVADVTGSPALGTAVNVGINAAPLVLLKGGKAAPARAKPRGEIIDVTPSGEPPKQITEAQRLEIPTVMRKGAEPAAAAASAPLSLAPREATPGRTGNPAFDRAEPAKVGTVEPAEPAAPKIMDAPASAEGGLPLPDQAKRADVLRRIGIERARESAVKGDAKAAATDYQQSKVNNPAGDFMKRQLDTEREALAAHAEKIVTDTGGTPGLDSHALEARGHAILAPLESFKQWFTDQTSSLYKQARERAQGAPLGLDRFRGTLATDSKFSSTDTINLRKGIEARMRELKMADKDGNLLPATVEQAEALRQYVNEQWSPQANRTIKELKNALDEDVTASAGEDLFKQARALHAMKESIFSDPKGISSILDSEGINRSVPVEKVADKITAMPYAQFDHIVKTLERVPPELKPAAQQALAEVKAQFANRLTGPASERKGQWGARDVTRFLQQNGKKMSRVFTPEEMQAITDLNDAGHILAHDASYPGAAVQEHNLLKRGAMEAVRSGAASAGAFVGGPIGASVASSTVGALAGRFSDAAALKAAQKRTVKLSDFPK